MSRVEQALRRAGQATILPSEDDRVLDLYPAERDIIRPSAPPSPVAVADKAPERELRPAFSSHVASLDEYRSDEPRLRLADAYRTKIVTGGEVAQSTIEQYRRLAATLHHLQREQGLRSLMVTSAVPQEGKTLTIANLAVTLSESYKRRVLLIDADLRRPSVHEVFGISNRHGLCDTLESASGRVPFVSVSSHLSVLPAGSPEGDPMSTLASARMVDLLDEAALEFDWILLDAPPVGLMADAGLLVRLTRAVILVIGAGTTSYSVVEKVVTEIGRENIVGTVLNRADEDPEAQSPYYAYNSPARVPRSLPAANKVD